MKIRDFLLMVIITASALSEARADDFDVFKPLPSAAGRQQINYDAWTAVLRRIVWSVGPSDRDIVVRPETPSYSRIKIQNAQPSWLEGNRIHYHEMDAEHKAGLKAYRDELAGLPERIDLVALSRDEQLAYWLNLYNVTVVSLVAEEYPIVYLKDFHQKAWSEKRLVVKDISLSLKDIENHILKRYWTDPIVLYGLYQGAIGGPNIQKQAFTGANVDNLLNRSARGFVNSIRGIHKRTRKLRVSEYYLWHSEFFARQGIDLRRHMLRFANEETRALLALDEPLLADYFDWHITDLYNGRPNYGSSYPTMSVAPNGMLVGLGMPPQTVAMMKAFEIKFLKQWAREGKVILDDVVCDEKNVCKEK